MDRRSETQLNLIAEVSSLLGSIGVPCWLFGGWAIDFLEGSIARSHGDVEFIVWANDADRVRETLQQNGFEFDRNHQAEEMAGFVKYGETLEIYYIVRTPTNQIVTPGPWADWPWPDDAFGDLSGCLAGVRCCITSAEGLLQTKEGFAYHPAGRPPRDKDLQDIRRLRALLNRPE